MKKLIAGLGLLTTLLAAIPTAQAQKLGYVDTELIMSKMPGYAQAQTELETLSQTWQKEIEAQKKDVDKLHRTYQAEEVVLTEAMKKKRQDEIQLKEQEVKVYQNKLFGFEGQLFKKRQELNKPVQDQVFEALEKVAKKRGLGIIFDKAGDLTMLYTNPAHDCTEFVLEELGLGAEDRNQPGPKGVVKTIAAPKTPTDGTFESDSGQPDPAGPAKPAVKPGKTSGRKAPKGRTN